MDFEDVIFPLLAGMGLYLLYQRMQMAPVAATPVTVAQSNAPNPTPVSTAATVLNGTGTNGTPCSISPTCTAGQPCSALRIGGVMNNGVCGPVTLGLGRYR